MACPHPQKNVLGGEVLGGVLWGPLSISQGWFPVPWGPLGHGQEALGKGIHPTCLSSYCTSAEKSSVWETRSQKHSQEWASWVLKSGIFPSQPSSSHLALCLTRSHTSYSNPDPHSLCTLTFQPEPSSPSSHCAMVSSLNQYPVPIRPPSLPGQGQLNLQNHLISKINLSPRYGGKKHPEEISPNLLTQVAPSTGSHYTFPISSTVVLLYVCHLLGLSLLH